MTFGIGHNSRKKRAVCCGARTRRGSSCIRKPLENGRCPNHGGLSTGPSPEGRVRIAALMRARWAAQRQAGETGTLRAMRKDCPPTECISPSKTAVSAFQRWSNPQPNPLNGGVVARSE